MRSLIQGPAIPFPPVSPRNRNLALRHFNLPIHSEMLVFIDLREIENGGGGGVHLSGLLIKFLIRLWQCDGKHKTQIPCVTIQAK